MFVCVCMRVCVYVCEETASENKDKQLSNRRTYLPHIAIKIAKKTVPPLSNKYVTLMENEAKILITY